MIRAALHDLMDRMPGQDVGLPIRRVAESVREVRAIEKLHVRRVGMGYHVIVHVQADPGMSLDVADAHGARVKREICEGNLHVQSVLVHMEPYRADSPRMETFH